VTTGIVAYLIRRLVAAVPLLLGLTLLLFVLVHLAPGDPVAAFVSEQSASPEFIEQARKNFGLDKPLPVQYVIYLSHLLHGDLGRAYGFGGKPVLVLIKERIAATLVLQALAIALALFCAIPLGIISAVRQYSVLDHTATVGAFIGLALPNFWLALLLQFYLSVKLGWLPALSAGQAQAPLAERWKFVLMPVLALALPLIAYFTRFVRSAMLEVLRQDYLTTARAKGLSERVVLWRHALRNALIPLITVTGLQVAHIVGGAVIIEQIFAWPGLGNLTYEAITRRDYPVILGVTLLAGVFVVVVNIVVDLLYVLVDPRVTFDRA